MTWYSDNIKFDDDDAEILNQFHECVEANDIKGARKLLRSYAIFNQLDTRKLNKLLSIPGYRFAKRNDQLTLYKPVNKEEKNKFVELENLLHDDSLCVSSKHKGLTNLSKHEQETEHEQQRFVNEPGTSGPQPNEFVIETLAELRESIKQNRIELEREQEQAHIGLIHAVEQKLSEIIDLVNQHNVILNNILQQQTQAQTHHANTTCKHIDNRPYSYIKSDVPSRFDEGKPLSAYSTQQSKPKPAPTNTAAAFREQLRIKQQQEKNKLINEVQ